MCSAENDLMEKQLYARADDSLASNLITSVAILIPSLFGLGIYLIHLKQKALLRKKHEEQVRWWVMASVFVSTFGALLGALFKSNMDTYNAHLKKASYQKQYREVAFKEVLMFLVGCFFMYKNYLSASSAGGISPLRTL